MKKFFCPIAVILALLPLTLSAQEFNPVRGPLEGVWKIEDEELIIFTGNLMLHKNIWSSSYDITPGIVYENGKAFGPAESNETPTEYEVMFNYELSENALKIIVEGDELICPKSPDDILQNKGPLEGIWTGTISDSDTTETLIWIIIGELLIEATETDSYTNYGGALEFIYSDLDNTLTALGEAISCAVSGDTMTITNDFQTVVLTRGK
ncbi:MAG: hypothetical protein LBK02_07020 [Treponema sp.]|nr:hypothetical protein [Treponema sp.]